MMLEKRNCATALREFRFSTAQKSIHGILRTLLVIIVLSTFATPVFSASGELRPKILTDENFNEIPTIDGIVPEFNDGSLKSITSYSFGYTTAEAICSVFGNFAEWFKTEEEIIGNKTIRTSEFVVWGGIKVSKKSFYEETVEKELIEIKKNDSVLRCQITHETIYNTDDGFSPTSTETIIKEKVGPSGDTISLSSIQSDNVKVLIYGISGGKEEVIVMLAIGFYFP